jgi:hypothetical protein
LFAARHIAGVAEAIEDISTNRDDRAIRQRGSGGLTLVTLDDGFHIMYPNGGGGITEWERAASGSAAWIFRGSTVAASHLNALTVERAIEHIQTYKPDGYELPDAPITVCGAIEPIVEAIKDQNPNDLTVSKEDQTPVCLNTHAATDPGQADRTLQFNYLWGKAPVLSTTTTPPFMTQRTFLTAASISVSGSPSTPTISAK